MLLPAVYISGDELERALARAVGYRAACQHPGEIGVPDAGEVLVIDCGRALFGDIDVAARAAREHAGRGGMVGLHGHDLDAPELAGLTPLPDVVTAKNHKALLFELGRHARLPKRLRRRFAEAARSLEGDEEHAREDVPA